MRSLVTRSSGGHARPWVRLVVCDPISRRAPRSSGFAKRARGDVASPREAPADGEARPPPRRYVDIGANLTDGMFRGEYHGKKVHREDLARVLLRARATRGWRPCWSPRGRSRRRRMRFGSRRRSTPARPGTDPPPPRAATPRRPRCSPPWASTHPVRRVRGLGRPRGVLREARGPLATRRKRGAEPPPSEATSSASAIRRVGRRRRVRLGIRPDAVLARRRHS